MLSLVRFESCLMLILVRCLVERFRVCIGSLVGGLVKFERLGVVLMVLLVMLIWGRVWVDVVCMVSSVMVVLMREREVVVIGM